MASEIRERCLDLLVDRMMHPAEIAGELRITMGQVQAALHEGWDAFRQVAGATGFTWTRADSPRAIAAQRETVKAYTPAAYAARSASRQGPVARRMLTRGIAEGRLSGATAVGRALYALGSGTLEELAASAGVPVRTIRQQASRFRADIQTTRAPVRSSSGLLRMRVVRLSLLKSAKS